MWKLELRLWYLPIHLLFHNNIAGTTTQNAIITSYITMYRVVGRVYNVIHAINTTDVAVGTCL